VKDLRGKVVTVNVWATWCGPCVGEFPNMKTQYEKYKDRGYEMIACSIDSDLDAVVNFQEKNQYPWLVGSQVKSKGVAVILGKLVS
jgi:thiol-disulfide isomerase/thioredoxin